MNNRDISNIEDIEKDKPLRLFDSNLSIDMLFNNQESSDQPNKSTSTLRFNPKVAIKGSQTLRKQEIKKIEKQQSKMSLNPQLTIDRISHQPQATWGQYQP